jgi:subtilisin family serine protease
MLKHLCLGSWLLAATAGTASAATIEAGVAAKIAPALLAKLDGAARQDVLVVLKDQADLTAAKALKAKADKGRFIYGELTGKARSTQDGVVADLKNAGLSFKRFYVTNAIAVRGASADDVARLAARKDVLLVSSDAPARAVSKPVPAQLVPEAALKSVGDDISSTGADRVWSELGARGEGIVIAGADTGIDWTHPALKTHYRGWDAARSAADHDFNWHDAITEQFAPTANTCGYDLTEPCDDNSHGTHTIGTTLGDDGRGNQIGMAPGATWIGCRNMDGGVGRPSSYIDCFEWFLAPYPHGGDAMRDGDPQRSPDVINNSWGCPADEGCNGTEFLPALNALAEAGIMVVVAAGNDGPSCSTIHDAPAHHTDEAFVVGAVDHRSGTIASFSSRGPSAYDNKVGPDLSAPGVNVRSSVPGGTYSGTLWSGTSMASPHVAGAVALLWSHEPALKGDIAATVARFTATATAKTTSQTCGGVSGSTIPNNTYGYGIMNVYAAATAPH